MPTYEETANNSLPHPLILSLPFFPFLLTVQVLFQHSHLLLQCLSDLLSRWPTLKTAWRYRCWTSLAVYVMSELLEVLLDQHVAPEWKCWECNLCWRVGDDSLQGRDKDNQREDRSCDTERHSDMHARWEVQLDIICRSWQDIPRAWSRQKVFSWGPG